MSDIRVEPPRPGPPHDRIMLEIRCRDGSRTIEYFEDAPGYPLVAQLPAAVRRARDSGASSATQQAVDVDGPCPCGSGEKFKLCCREKTGKGPRAPSPIAL